jgi:hypothetical protein
VVLIIITLSSRLRLRLLNYLYRDVRDMTLYLGKLQYVQ